MTHRLGRALSMAVVVALALARPLPAQDEAPEEHAPDRPGAAAAFAVPLNDIAIDGKLDDWPEGLPRYPVLTNFSVYGPNDLDGVDLSDSDDLSAYFMVGYNRGAAQVYLAVVVRDDEHVVGQNFDATDAVEVYIEGGHRRGDDPRQGWATPQQISGVAGNGSYNGDGRNPSMLWGDVAQTGTRFGFARDGDTVVYEFALDVVDRPNGAPVDLVPGARVGWDVGVVDKDANAQPPSLVYWGAVGANKYVDPWLLGDLEMVADRTDLKEITGTVERAGDGRPYAGLDIEAWRGEEPCGVARTDAEGRFTLALPDGRYTLRPARFNGAQPGQSAEIEAPTLERAVELEIAPIAVPPAVARAAERYRELRSYHDQTLVQVIGEQAQGTDVRHEIALEFAAERPNRVRFATASPHMRGLVVTSDGRQVAAVTAADGPAAPPVPAPPRIGEFALSEATGGATAQSAGSLPMPGVIVNSRLTAVPLGGLVGGLWAHRLVLAEDPLAELLRHADRIEELGPATLDGNEVTVVEVTKPAYELLTLFPYVGSRRGPPVAMRLWIGTDDGLIHQTRFQFDMATCFPPGERQNIPPAYVTWTTIHQSIRADEPLDASLFEVPPKPIVKPE